MDNIRPILTEADYDWAIAEITRYFDNEPVPGMPEADRFDVLAELIEAYEAKHYPVAETDPVGSDNRSSHSSAMLRK
jgi:HTH-type transcriptional regulator/antitoxin HigA